MCFGIAVAFTACCNNGIMRKKIFTFAAAILAGISVFGQSKDFKLGQWVEIHNAILSELGRTYVDSLPVGRMQKAGINAMLEALDPYTVYVPEEDQEDFQMMIGKTYGGIGAIIYKPEKDGNVIINEPYAGSPAARAGLVCGDEILEIDGVTTHGLEASQASDKMKGKPGTTVVFKVKKLRSGEVVDVPVTRERIHLPDVEYASMLNDTTGYILQTGFTDNVSSDIRNAYFKLKNQGMKKLVLDLRGNGGGLMSEAVNIVSLFVPKGSLVVSQKGRDAADKTEYKTTLNPIDTEIPLVILVDGGSASSSEIVTGALQDLDRATVMGKRTYGKGLVQTIRPLPYNGQLKITTSKYYTPSGRCVQAIDYANRNEDGSVGAIPDSLTHEFKTLHGRPVRDGGGITPDIIVEGKHYSRLVYSLVLNGIVEQYALKFVRDHESIPAIDDFHFNDYDDFVAYAKEREFDYRSSAMALFDSMKQALEEDGLDDEAKEQLDALKKVIDLDKEQFLRNTKDESVPFSEEEIAVRDYFQEAGIKVRLRYDTQLKEALEKPLIKF